MTTEAGAMDVDAAILVAPPELNKESATSNSLNNNALPTTSTQSQVREMYRQLPVRVHVRRPGKDNWMYIGRATVSHEVMGQTSLVVVRTGAEKVLVTFGEVSEVRG